VADSGRCFGFLTKAKRWEGVVNAARVEAE
jgi:hypothetical protein